MDGGSVGWVLPRMRGGRWARTLEPSAKRCEARREALETGAKRCEARREALEAGAWRCEARREALEAGAGRCEARREALETGAGRRGGPSGLPLRRSELIGWARERVGDQRWPLRGWPRGVGSDGGAGRPSLGGRWRAVRAVAKLARGRWRPVPGACLWMRDLRYPLPAPVGVSLEGWKLEKLAESARAWPALGSKAAY